MTGRTHVPASLRRRVRITVVFRGLALIIAANPAGAQDLVVANARIIDGAGNVIERGSVVVEAGRIVSVTADQVPAEGRTYVDARGMTVLPGLIETHVHFSAFRYTPPDQYLARMSVLLADYLESGFTTALDTFGHLPTLSEARDLIDRGELAGPRLLLSGTLLGPGRCRFPPVTCAEGFAVEVTDTLTARAEVRRFVDGGADMIKVIFEAFPVPETMMADAVLAAIAEEADALGVPLIIHSVRAPDALRAIELGADKFVHAPVGPVREPVDIAHFSQVLVDASIPFAPTAHLRAPLVDESGHFTDHFGGVYRDPGEREMAVFLTALSRIRQAWDAGVTIAFGTDGFSTEHARHEIETLSRAFSPAEIITMLTQNASVFLDMEDEIGTLSLGKFGDLVLIDGDPLADITDLANVRLVVKEGRIVVDSRE